MGAAESCSGIATMTSWSEVYSAVRRTPYAAKDAQSGHTTECKATLWSSQLSQGLECACGNLGVSKKAFIEVVYNNDSGL